LEGIKFLSRFFDIRAGFTTVLTVIFLSISPAKSIAIAEQNHIGKTEKLQTVRQVTGQLLDAAQIQYKRGLFAQAEKTIAQTQDYQKYLTAEQKRRLDRLSRKTAAALAERKVILEHIEKTDALIRQKQLSQAEEYLKNYKDSVLLQQNEREQITAKLKTLNNLRNEQLKHKTDRHSNNQAPVSEPQPVNDARLLEDMAVPQENDSKSVLEEKNKLRKLNQKKKILQSYRRAVVKQAVADAKYLVNEGKFYRAQQAVELARRAVSKHRLDIGEQLFERYTAQLKELTGQIAQGRARWLGSWESRGAWKL